MYIFKFTELEVEYLKDVCDMTLDDPGSVDTMTLLAVEDLHDRVENEQFDSFTRVDVFVAKLLMDIWGACEPLYDEQFLEALWLKFARA